jgi:hypothetical protein
VVTGSVKGERSVNAFLSSITQGVSEGSTGKARRQPKKLLRLHRGARKRSATACLSEAGSVPSSTMPLEAG